MGIYSAQTYRQEKTIYYSDIRNQKNFVHMKYQDGEPAPNPLETLLSALSACKLVNFWDLADKYKITFEDANINITAVVGPNGIVDGTHQPINTIKSIHTVWNIKSEQSDQEIEDFFRIVEAVCTVGNSLNPAIESTHEIKRS